MTKAFEAAINNIKGKLKDRKVLYIKLLKYLDTEEDTEEKSNEKLDDFVAHFQKSQEGQTEDYNKVELDDLLRLISHLAAAHHRSQQFFPRIINLLDRIKDQISQCYTNEQLFNLFLHEEPIQFLLKDKGMLEFNSNTNDIIASEDNKDVNLYHNPGITEGVEEYQRTGENHNQLCQFIRLGKEGDFQQTIVNNNIPLNSKIEPSRFETNSFLLDNKRNPKEVTLLQYAAFCGISQSFRDYFYDNAQELFDQSLWEYIICSRSDDFLQFMVKNDVGQPKDHFDKCFELAVTCHHSEFIEKLQNINVEVQVQPAENATDPPPPQKYSLDPLLRAAILAHNYDVISRKFNTVKEDDLNELFQIACKAGFHPIIQELIQLPGIKVNACGKLSALHKACNIGDVITVKLLLAHPDIDINLQSVAFVHDVSNPLEYDGLTALERAVRYHHTEIVNLLLSDDRIDIDKKSRWRGNAPLHICGIYGNSAAVPLLLQKQANSNNQSHDEYRIRNNLELTGGRETPLHYAVKFNHKNVVSALLKNNDVNKELENWENKKPVDCTDNEDIKSLFN